MSDGNEDLTLAFIASLTQFQYRLCLLEGMTEQNRRNYAAGFLRHLTAIQLGREYDDLSPIDFDAMLPAMLRSMPGRGGT